MFAFGSWQGTAGSQRLELSVANVGTTGYHCKELPVPRGWNSWFPTWEPEVTIASNCRFPEVGTHASQPGKHRLPLQGTAGSQRLELTLPNLGTMGYHCKQLLNDMKIFSLQLYGFAQSTGTEPLVLRNGPVPECLRLVHGKELLVPKQVTIARNCRFPEDGTLCSQPGNQRLPFQATAGSQRLELLVSNLGTTGYHCKELPVPRGWNSWFPTWEPEVTIASNCRFPEVGTHASQPWNHRLPLQGTSGSQRLELLVPNLGTMGYHCKQLLK